MQKIFFKQMIEYIYVCTWKVSGSNLDKNVVYLSPQKKNNIRRESCGKP